MTPVRIALVVAFLLGLPGAGALTGCGSPCGNLWKKLEGCAKSDTDKKVYKSKDMQRAFRARCKKSNKSRVKSCLKLRDCKKIRRCAGRIRK